MFHPDFGNEVVEGVLTVDRHALHFESPSGLEEIPVLRLEVNSADDSGKIYFTDTARPGLSFFTLDESILDSPGVPQLRKVSEEIGESAGRRELYRRLRILGYFAAACFLIMWMISFGTELMIRRLVAKVPMEWERSFGRAEVEMLVDTRGGIEHSNEVKQLEKLAAPLVSVVPLGTNKVEFFIADDPMPNAFALPGGYVVVNAGLLDLTDRPEQLLGVLAHELAHVTQRHYERKVISAGGTMLLFGLLLHSRNGMVNLVGQGSELMMMQGFSKEYETEADEVGWKYLVAANVDPRGMVEMFQKFKTYEMKHKEVVDLPRAFQSHPVLDKRIARLERNWKKLPRKTGFLEITNHLPQLDQRTLGPGQH